MKRSFAGSLILSFVVFLTFPSNANAQNNEIIVPAGTLIRCTLSEPNFSSKTADIGDPVVCPLSGLILFDRSVFPRGAYLGGHLDADKDPGHFFGKGYLKLVFDHIGMPDAEVPVPAKVVSAKGYRVDKEGKIIGHGHATRDTVEWMMPPLWPIKVLTLPDRGPRPTLKGEEQFVLRLMDDVPVPAQPMPGWHFFGKSSSQNLPLGGDLTLTPHQTTAANEQPAAARPTLVARTITATNPPDVREGFLVLRSGARYITASVRVDGNRINFTTPNGISGATTLDEVDWTKTHQLIAESITMLALNTH